MELFAVMSFVKGMLFNECCFKRENSPCFTSINVLFGLRSAKVDHDRLTEIWNEIYSLNSMYYVDKFELQKIIKDYLGNIDSSLDYLHKFVGFLR